MRTPSLSLSLSPSPSSNPQPQPQPQPQPSPYSGKTTGNTEPRVYQGFVDEPQNALNDIGLQQAEPLG